jgi:hypothetical protein
MSELYHEIVKKALIRHRYYLCDCLPEDWNDHLVNKDCIECLKEVITEYGWVEPSKRVDIQNAFTKYSESKEIKDWVALGMPYTSPATWEYRGPVIESMINVQKGKLYFKGKCSRVRNSIRDELWYDLTKTIDTY